MSDLSTTYLGLKLDSPFMLGASPLVADADLMRRAEDAGASAVVMRSLFEEQDPSDDGPYTTGFDRKEFTFGPLEYLEQIRKLKSALSVPVVGSLNGTTTYGWTAYSALIDQAGADALELNLYRVETDFERSAEQVENDALEVVRAVVSSNQPGRPAASSCSGWSSRLSWRPPSTSGSCTDETPRRGRRARGPPRPTPVLASSLVPVRHSGYHRSIDRVSATHRDAGVVASPWNPCEVTTWLAQ
jgi:hypothetical protein